MSWVQFGDVVEERDLTTGTRRFVEYMEHEAHDIIPSCSAPPAFPERIPAERGPAFFQRSAHFLQSSSASLPHKS